VFFALFVWAVALRSVMVGERIIYDFITVVSWENWQRLEHILLFFSLPMFIYFFYRFFEIKNMFYPHMIAFLSFVLIILTLFLPAVSFTQFGLVSQIMVLFTIIYMLIMLALLIKQNKPFSILFSVSFFGWTLLVMHDYLYTNLYIQSRPLAQFGLVFFVIFQMYLLWQHSKRESRLLMHVKASIDRSTHYLESKYKTSSHDACFVLNDWFSAIELYCDVLNLPIYMEDGSLSVCCEAGQLQDVVLVLARMAERDGIQASLYVGRDAKSVRFEFIFNKVIHNQEMLHDELNSVHHLLNDMETLLIIERLSTTTKMSFTLPIFELKSALQGVEEKPAIEYFGNNLAEPILFASDYQELIITSLSDYFYLIKASITTENIEKYRPKLIVWQVKKWNGYILEDMKRIQKEHSSVPIILVVDGYNKTQLAQCIRMGITDYVVSPVLPEELLLKIQRVHNVNTVVMPSSQDLRDVTVQLVRDSIAMWQKYSGKSKIELAENSRLWRVYMDGSTAKTRTLDKYLSLQTLPKNPRWETVNRTVHYVLEQCSLDEKDKLLLNQQLSMFNRLLAS
jgi:CheY-like chemotaxis protein